MDVPAKRKLFATNHIHIFPGDRKSTDPFASSQGFNNSKEALKYLGVDFKKIRTVYGKL